MKYSSAGLGRVLVIRLEDGDVVHRSIEEVAQREGIMRAAFGRDDMVVAGCIRRGVKTWVIGEVIVIELTDSDATRRLDSETGFELLEP